MAGHQGEDRERSAQGERAGLAHEDLGGVRVEPEEAKHRADGREREADDEVLLLTDRDYSERRDRDRRRAAREVVQPVGNADRDDGGEHDDGGDHDVDRAERETARPGHVEALHIEREVEHAADAHGEQREQQELEPPGQPRLRSADERARIVEIAECGERNDAHQRQQD